MGIHESTRIQAYQLRPGGVRARMAILKMIAATSVHNANPHTRLQPGDWRGARDWGLHSYEAAFSTLSAGIGQWYCHAGPAFRDERDCHHVLRTLRHTGWFTDDGDGEMAIGIVSGLSHGRFIAGYRWTANDERVYFPGVFDSEDDSAHMCDEHARVFAGAAWEDNDRFHAMSDAELAIDDAMHECSMAVQARNVSAAHRERAIDAIAALRKCRDALAVATRAYERG